MDTTERFGVAYKAHIFIMVWKCIETYMRRVLGRLLAFILGAGHADLPQDEDPAALAAYRMAVAHGIAVQVKAGFTRAKLLDVATQALRGWPA